MSTLNKILILFIIGYLSYTAFNYVNDVKHASYQEGYDTGFDNASTTRIMYDNAIIIVENHTLNNSEKSELYIKGTKEVIDNGTVYRVNLQHV